MPTKQTIILCKQQRYLANLLLYGARLSVLVLALAATGCKGTWRGKVISPAVDKVVLFDMEGPYGPEFTDMLAAELTDACKGRIVVIKAREALQSQRADEIENPSSYVREIGADTFVKGRITRSERVQINKYYLMVSVDLYDARDEGVIGGVPDARYVGDLDFGVDWTQKHVGPSSAQKVHSALAWWVAMQLAHGLGHR